MVVRPDSPDPAAQFPAETQQHVSDATTDVALRDVCAQIYERLGRLEAAVQRTEGLVADRPWDLSSIAFKRLERVDETLRAVQRSLDESTLPEMCVNIERQIVQTRAALQRNEQPAADESLRQLWQNIDARLERTEDSLRRTEGIVAEWLQGAEETIHRIERIVSSRTVESMQSPRASAVDLPLHSDTDHRGVPLPWMAGLAATALVLVTIAIGVLFWTGRGMTRERTAAPAATQRVATASPQPVAVALREAPAVALTTNAPAPAREEQLAASKRPSPDRRPALITTRPETFVGTLSITSVPSGASVSINGKAAGVTPLRLPKQRAGSLAVQIAQDGFERWSAAVRVPADQLTQVTARLRPIAQ